MHEMLPFGLTIIGEIKSIPVKCKGNIESRHIKFRDEDMTDYWEISLDSEMTWGTSCMKTRRLAQEILAKYIPAEITEKYCTSLFAELASIPRDMNFWIDIPIRKSIT